MTVIYSTSSGKAIGFADQAGRAMEQSERARHPAGRGATRHRRPDAVVAVGRPRSAGNALHSVRKAVRRGRRRAGGAPWRNAGGGERRTAPAVMGWSSNPLPGRRPSAAGWARPFCAMATGGHLGDLPAEAGSVDPGDGFAMIFEACKGALRTLGAIARAVARGDTLVLATGPYREGEAIAWQVPTWASTTSGSRSPTRVRIRSATPGGSRKRTFWGIIFHPLISRYLPFGRMAAAPGFPLGCARRSTSRARPGLRLLASGDAGRGGVRSGWRPACPLGQDHGQRRHLRALGILRPSGSGSHRQEQTLGSEAA